MARPYIDGPIPPTSPVAEHAMGLALSFHNEDGYLRVTICGSWEPKAIQWAIDSVRREALDRCYSRILIDALELEPARYGHHKYSAAKQIAEQWGPSMRVALLRQAEFQDELIEQVANNRGARVAVKAAQDEAIAWLLHEPTPQRHRPSEENASSVVFSGPVWISF